MARKRKAVTEKDVARFAGIPSPGVTTGKVDNDKTRQAKIAEVAMTPRNQKQAGMMMGPAWNLPPWGTTSLDAFNTSYATGNSAYGGTRDIPTYFVMMNQQNGGILYWPVSLREKYEWYRYWARCWYTKTYEAKVLMSDGTEKNIEDVEIGEEVITALGTVKKVKDKFERRFKTDKAVTIKAWCLQNPMQVTHHHPFYVLKNTKVEYYGKKKDTIDRNMDIDFTPEWIHAEHLEIGDYVLMAPFKPEKESDITEAQARLLGYYAAEGSIIWGKRCIRTDEKGKEYKWNQEKIKVPVGISFSINKNEIDTLGKSIINTIKEVFNIDARYVREKENSINIDANGREIGEFCFYHCGVYSDKKKLSQELICANIKSKKEFISAYFDGDGHLYDDKTYNEGKIIIGTASANLASQVQMMAISSGIMCRIAKYKRTENSGFNSNTDNWHITIPSWCSNEVLKLSSKHKEWDDQSTQRNGALMINGYAAFKIKEITYSAEDDIVYNLEVDAEGDEKSYICNGAINHNTDAYVGRALDLLTDLPLSKIELHVPKIADKTKQQEIKDFYEYMCERINLFERLQQILYEFNTIGNTFIFAEFDKKDKMWNKLVILPPEEINSFSYPFSDNARIEYRPEKLLQIIKQYTDDNTALSDPFIKSIIENIPKDIIDMVRKEDCIVMDSDPMEGGVVGSFCYNFARRRHPYLDLGSSILERVLIPLLMKENFRYTQLALATRNMTPKNKISAPGLNANEILDLRQQIDLSYMDPDYSVVTNYDWTWEQLGAEGRILDLSSEYERIENSVFAGLGVTRELLTGEGTYTGNRITVEILNSVFLLTREMLIKYVEKYLFEPIAEANGWYEEVERGSVKIKKYWHPRVGFNRLTIRDNQEVFENLFQLYQKGSLPVDVIYELLNLDSDSMHDRIKDDLFTVKDPTFNRAVENINDNIGNGMVEASDAMEKAAHYLGFKLKEEKPEGESEGEGEGGEGFGEGFEKPEEGAPEEKPEEAPKEEKAPKEEAPKEEKTEEKPVEETVPEEEEFKVEEVAE